MKADGDGSGVEGREFVSGSKNKHGPAPVVKWSWLGTHKEEAMKSFLEKHARDIIGVLNGWDRAVFRGTLRLVANVAGMRQYLWQCQVLLKEFTEHAKVLTGMLLDSSAAQIQRSGRHDQYLASSRERKEDIAREIAKRDGIDRGLICRLRCVEPCMTYEIHRNRERKELELQMVPGRCLHLYQYWVDPFFGFMGGRIQTWFPFTVHLWFNGREWLARQMDAAGIEYERADNCFTWIEGFERAQKLMDRLGQTNWPVQFDRLARLLNRAHRRMFAAFPMSYYWSAHQTEWATDLAFRSPEALASIFPQLARGAIVAFSCRDALRFLGKRLKIDKTGDVTASYLVRPEGIRVKHSAGGNSVKLYDKAGQVLRAECTINQHRQYRVYRRPESSPRGPKKWLPMRKGVADLHARSRISQGVNVRYLEALAQLDTTERVEDIVGPVCKSKNGSRPLKPWSEQDQALLQAVSVCGLAGDFRNRDLARQLYPEDNSRQVSSKVTYRLRLLRAHGLIHRLPNTRRYRITTAGARIIATIFLTQKATAKQLSQAAA
jgi:hypothetical protein